MDRGTVTIFKNLTGYEIETLPEEYNLTDGHAFRSWTADEEAVISRSAEFFKRHNRQEQPVLEREYVRDFLALARQTDDESRVGYLMCFTASMAFEITLMKSS